MMSLILLRRMQIHRRRVAHVVADLSSYITPRVSVAAAMFSSLTRTVCPLRVFVCNVKDVRHCLPYLVSVRCHLHITRGLVSYDLSHNVDNNSSSGKMSTAESVKSTGEMETVAITNDSSLVKHQLSLAKDLQKSDMDSQKTESRIHLDESQRELVVYVEDAFMKTKATDLYMMIKKMETEQVCMC